MQKLIFRIQFIFLCIFPLVGQISRADAPTVAASCVACHGNTGISANDIWPNLRGQKKDYLMKQIRAFKSGERKDPVMNAIVASLSEADISTIADYFSKIADSK